LQSVGERGRTALFSSDDPGVPFDGCPVFRTPPRSEQVSERCSSRRLPLPFRALTHSLSAARPFGRTRLAPDALGRERQPSWALVLFSACRRGGPQQRGCQVPPEPARSVSTLAANRAVKAISTPCRVCFAPTTLLSFRLQGFEPPGEEAASPPPFLPCRFAPHSDGAYGFEGLDPPGSRTDPPRRPDPVPSWRSSPLRLSLPPPWGSASRLPPLTRFELRSAP
jgi:hypothetical protein